MARFRSTRRFKRPPKDLLNAVIMSLESGRGWSFDDFRAYHEPSGVEVWLANDLYGIHIEIKAADERHLYGEVVCFGRLSRWRRKLWSAAMRAKNKFGPRDKAAFGVHLAICNLVGGA